MKFNGYIFDKQNKTQKHQIKLRNSPGGVLKDLEKFTRKYMCQVHFFNKVTDLKPAIVLKKAHAQVFFYDI